MTVLDYINSLTSTFKGGELCAQSSDERPHAALNPSHMKVRLSKGVHAGLTVLHTEAIESQIEIELDEGAALELCEIYTASAFCSVKIKGAADSQCSVVSCVLESANVDYELQLDGRNASNIVRGVFVTTASEHAVFGTTVRHNSSDCKSDSMVRGVVSGNSTGEFHGLVYVAPDAQRTDAQQQSRNLQLSDGAHVVTRPQLEIYADDVRCSHGATVGQMNDEAIMYMRQRGLSEQEARKLQVEGFVAVATADVRDDELREMLQEACTDKIEKL